jgi:Xaa-Pro aminopeptidase
MSVKSIDKNLEESNLDCFLKYSESAFDSNMYYLTRFLSSDPFIFLRSAQISTIVVSGMEKSRASKTSMVDRVCSYLDYKSDWHLTDPESSMIEMLSIILQTSGLKKVGVDSRFPVKLADLLREEGYVVRALSGIVENPRIIKSTHEIQLITDVQRACERSLETALNILSKSNAVDELLYYKSEVLTSEKLKASIGCSLITKECSADDIIASSGTDSAIPHLSGSGPVKANAPIVFDIFPRSIRSRYRTDMSRTVVKGDPQKELEEMYDAVVLAQTAALSLIKAGVTGAEVHQAVVDHFEQSGFKTDITKGYGFTHSTGHGLGLDVHELPYLSKSGGLLQSGNVVTVEPGLYYPKIGGIRIEDAVVITDKGYKNITRFDKRLVI